MTKHLPGVYTAKRKDGSILFRASLTYRNKHISLGSFDSEQSAHEAYLFATRILTEDTCSLSQYTDDSALPFEKWVILINFRDNGIYFATPIYIRPKFFYYYFTPRNYFIFDMEDLFYYSSHKISCRGGHYFVADYGIQVNIMSRYGIKNYASENVDYRFINGNNKDFRYENIEIINRYNGVKQIWQNGALCYQVKIHVKGNYTVGTYATEKEAAIAYNKAIDALKKAGVTKDYSPNYMEDMSPSAYADLYSFVKIAPRLQAYLSE